MSTGVITDLAVIDITGGGLVLVETAPGVTPEQVVRATAAPLRAPDPVGLATT